MTYRVEISPTANQDIENIFLWLQQNVPNQSYRWVRGCYEIMLTLENFPNRCTLAPESESLDLEIRQLWYQKKYRILFSVTEHEDQRTVQIHRVRHGSQKQIESLEEFFNDHEEGNG